jgi:glycosyltransferase involved in cell wall biosynthesis
MLCGDALSQMSSIARKAGSDDARGSLVSVMIPTKNSSKTIGKCLESIMSQTYCNIEIIVIDNFSKDGTSDIARRYGAQVLLKGPERAAQLNHGAAVARGKYLYRVDSDFVLEPSLIHEAVLACENQAFDGVVVHVVSDPSVSFWGKVRMFEREMRRDNPKNVAVRFLKRDKFIEVGGFDTGLVAGEDYDLHIRLLSKGARFGRIVSCEKHIGEPLSTAEVTRNFFYMGRTLPSYLRKHRSMALLQFSPVKLSYLRQLHQFVQQPLLGLGFAAYQAIRYYAAALGFLVGLIEHLSKE